MIEKSDQGATDRSDQGMIEKSDLWDIFLTFVLIEILK